MVTTLAVCMAVLSVVNGQMNLWQDTNCQKQILAFHTCKANIYKWAGEEDRINASQKLFNECVEKNGCMPLDNLPHDLDWRKRKCSTDVGEVVKQKVIACVRLRVSPDFMLPEDNPYTYGRFSYEAIPIPISSLETACKRGDYQGAIQCFREVSNRTMMSEEKRKSYYEKACNRRADCYKNLDDTCLAKLDAYRQSFCECAYDVHELYGGTRLMLMVPACAGLVNDKKGKYVTGYQRESCALEDMDERDYMLQMCTLGYDKYQKVMKEKMANTTTTTTTTASVTTRLPAKKQSEE